jgi:hypothetical protein
VRLAPGALRSRRGLRFREAAYQSHCDRIAEDCAGIQDEAERKDCEETLLKIRRWFKYRQDFAPDIVREIGTIERGLE